MPLPLTPLHSFWMSASHDACQAWGLPPAGAAAAAAGAAGLSSARAALMTTTADSAASRDVMPDFMVPPEGFGPVLGESGLYHAAAGGRRPHLLSRRQVFLGFWPGGNHE